MFDEKHYVPILKWKAGEYRSLRDLASDVRQGLTPLVEVPRIPWDHENDVPSRTLDAHTGPVPQALHDHWSTERPLFLDCSCVEDEGLLSNGVHPLTHLANEAENLAVQVIPVTGVEPEPSYLAAVQELGSRRGVCIRLLFEEVAFPNLGSAITSIRERLGLPPDACDLVIDFAAISSASLQATATAATAAMNAVPEPHLWRTLTLAGSGFPENLAAFGPDSAGTIPRSEWMIWRDLHGVARVPTFGDYAIAHPLLPDVDFRVMRMSANLRYCTDSHWLILKAREARRHGFDQFRTLCQIMVDRPEYCGPEYSWGDQFISDCATGSGGPGNAATWRQVGTTHHLTFVVRQIANLP